MTNLTGGSFAARCSRFNLELSSKVIGFGITNQDMRCVEENWNELGREHLQPPFEKTILNVLSFSEQDDEIKITCGLMLYRCLIARLGENLSSVHPFAVTGLAMRREGKEVLIGRRALTAASHGGWYETTPSGGVEQEDTQDDGSIDVFGRIASEFTEETNIPVSGIVNWGVFGFYYDDPTGTLDLILTLEIKGSSALIGPTEEYDSLDWMSFADVRNLLNRSDVKVVDVSRWALAEWLRGE